MEKSVLVQRLAVIVGLGRSFVSEASASFWAELVSCYQEALNEYWQLGDDVHQAVVAGVSFDFASPLAFAKFAEEAHLALLTLDESGDAWGSEFDTAFGNMVFSICCENGVDLEDDGYCNKATNTEICQYNIGRIESALAAAEPKVAAAQECDHHLRKAFEEAAYQQYFLSNITIGNEASLSVSESKDMASFVAKNADGEYIEPTLNAAWWAWQEATRQARAYTSRKGEAATEYCDSFGSFAPRFPATFRWHELFEKMSQADDPLPFKVGDRVYFGRSHFEFIGHVNEVGDSYVICSGVETGCCAKEKAVSRISYLQSLRVIRDDAEWARLTANEPAFLS